MNRFSAYLTAGLMLATVAGCGGGGGGGGSVAGSTSPPAYTGNPNAAVVTATNASRLTANVIGSSDTAEIIGGVSTESGNATQDWGSGMMHLAQRLNRNLRDAVARAGQARSTQQVVAGVLPVEQTDPCDSGSVRMSGTLNDNGTGTLAVSFNNCLIDGVTTNGAATLRVDAAMVTFSIVPTDSTLSFSMLTLRGSGLSIDAAGSLRLVLSTAPFGTETLTVNLVARDNNMGETGKTENLVIVATTMPPFTASISGKVFHPVHGYVNITTPASLVFGTLNQVFPDSGQLLLTSASGGAGNGSIRVTAIDSTLVQLELDTDGDATVDSTARLKWTDLTGPVGANLRDADGDGMHDSWETTYGLNPNLNDAAGDKDGDGQTNIQEYLAGTTP